MNGYEITELGQVREQENMLQRASAQALRRARRDARHTDDASSTPAWLVAFLGMKKRPATPPRHSHRPAHDPSCP